jgi:hypothetical protein
MRAEQERQAKAALLPSEYHMRDLIRPTLFIIARLAILKDPLVTGPLECLPSDSIVQEFDRNTKQRRGEGAGFPICRFKTLLGRASEIIQIP